MTQRNHWRFLAVLGRNTICSFFFNERGHNRVHIRGGFDSHSSQSPESYEEKASFFSKILFLWLNPILSLGSKRVLEANDLPKLSFLLFLCVSV